MKLKTVSSADVAIETVRHLLTESPEAQLIEYGEADYPAIKKCTYTVKLKVGEHELTMFLSAPRGEDK